MNPRCTARGEQRIPGARAWESPFLELQERPRAGQAHEKHLDTACAQLRDGPCSAIDLLICDPLYLGGRGILRRWRQEIHHPGTPHDGAVLRVGCHLCPHMSISISLDLGDL